MHKTSIAIIIPTYNEKVNIAQLIAEIKKYSASADIYVVDDNSPDGTQEIVKKIAKNKGHVFLVTRPQKNGRGGAVLTGFKKAYDSKKNYTFFIEMDADFSHSPSEINKLLEHAKKNQIVVGSRYLQESIIENWPLRRIIMSKLSNRYIRFLLGLPINDCTNGFRVYPRNAIKLLLTTNIMHKGFINLSETAYLLDKNKFVFKEVPITFRDRTQGKSNATFREVIKSLPAIIQIKVHYSQPSIL